MLLCGRLEAVWGEGVAVAVAGLMTEPKLCVMAFARVCRASA